jgi:large repetitive protein
VIESYAPGVDTPFSPADLRVLDYSKSNTISLQWQDRASNETGYQVWRAADGGTYNLLATLPANSTSYVDNGLPNNTAYDYIVRAVNGSIYSVFSSPVRGYTYATTVFINLNNSTSPDPGAPFNSLNWVYRSLGVVWNNFNDDKGNKTNIGLSEPVNWDEVETNGDVTGNNSGIFPDNAIVQSWLNFVGDSSYLVLTGLDVSKTYDLVLFGSCTDDNTQNSTSIYQVNGKTSMLNAHLNNTGTVTMFGIQPDQNGNASIGVNAYDSSNSSYSMIGVIIIKGYTPSTNTISQPPVSTATGTTTLDASAARFADSASDAANPIAAYPNPFAESYTLQVPATMGDNVTVTMSDASGRTVYVKRFEGLFQGNNYLNIVPDETLTHGLYFVRVIYGSGTNNNAKVFKVLKK